VTDYDQLVLILRRATGIANEMAKELARLYYDIWKTIDLTDDFQANKKRILKVYSEYDMKSSLNAKLLPIATASIAGAVAVIPELTTIPTTKKMVNDSMAIIMPESNISTNDLIARTKGVSQSQVVNYTKQAIDEGWTSRELRKALSVSESSTKKHVDTIARTSVNAVSNNSRMQLYKANDDMIDRVIYSATLDSRTSNHCSVLDGKVFYLEDAPVIPGHPNCRSSYVMLLKGEDAQEVIDDLLPRPAVVPKNEEQYEKQGLTTSTGKTRKPSKTDRSPLKGTQSNSESYESWLRKMPEYYQEDIIGVEATKEFNKGASLKSVINVSPITEKELNKAIN